MADDLSNYDVKYTPEEQVLVTRPFPRPKDSEPWKPENQDHAEEITNDEEYAIAEATMEDRVDEILEYRKLLGRYNPTISGIPIDLPSRYAIREQLEEEDEMRARAEEDEEEEEAEAVEGDGGDAMDEEDD